MNTHNTHVWLGRSGAQYEFQVFPWPTVFPPFPGIYIFCRLENFIQWAPIYVGQTEDLSTRFDDHHKMNCIQRYGVSHIHILGEMNGEPQRREIERDLILNLMPPCNG